MRSILLLLPGFQKWQLGFWSLLYLVHNLPQLHTEAVIFIPYSLFVFCCLRRCLNRCKHCGKGSYVPGPSLSHEFPLSLCISIKSFSQLMLSNCGAGKCSWESLGLQGDQTSQPSRKSTLNIYWKDWHWSWTSSNLAPWCKEPFRWKMHWYWERFKATGERGSKGWDGWMASLIQWTWVWANSGR